MTFQLWWYLTANIASVAADSFPFPGGDRTTERKSGRTKKHTWGEQKNWGEVGGGEQEGIPVSFPSCKFLETPATQATANIAIIAREEFNIVKKSI